MLAHVALEGEHSDGGRGHTSSLEAAPNSPRIRHETVPDGPLPWGHQQSHQRATRRHAMDYRVELIILPVSDVDRARAFYGDTLGWPVDHDQTVDENIRFVQVTPPGSACSIAFGRGPQRDGAGQPPGHPGGGGLGRRGAGRPHARGVEAQGVDDQPWGRFVSFADPDGNSWTVQELPDWSQQRLSGATAPKRDRPDGVPPPRRHPTGTGGLIACSRCEAILTEKTGQIVLYRTNASCGLYQTLTTSRVRPAGAVPGGPRR